MKETTERHQFCFSFMRSDTGGQKTKTFWGVGDTDDAYCDAREQAKRYRIQYQNELNEKKRQKEYYQQYRSSDIHVDIVSYSMWR